MEKKSKTKKIIFIVLCLLFMIFTGTILFSPYGKADGFNYKLIKNTIEINVSSDSLFNFLGNSSNASKWSVFVNHIKPLNNDSLPDGSVGSRRRCFCNANEQGRQWDELITEVISGKKRQLVIYNLLDFPLVAEHLATEQLYEPIDNNKCRLTFLVFFKDAKPTFMETIKMYIAAYTINSIFKKNMENIKRITETGQ